MIGLLVWVFLGFALPAVARDPTPKAQAMETGWLENLEAVLALNPDWSLYRCVGHSMRPVLEEGNLVILQESGFDHLQPGALAAYVNPQGIAVLHQIAEKTGAGFSMRGLRNDDHDPGVLTPRNFLGFVVGVFKPLPVQKATLVSNTPSLKTLHCLEFPGD